MIEKLEIDKNKLSLDKVSEIYKKYGFDIHDYRDLRFENQKMGRNRNNLSRGVQSCINLHKKFDLFIKLAKMGHLVL